MSTKREVLAAALQLTETDRVALVGDLLESVRAADGRDAQAWDREIQRRVEALDAGTAETLSWTEARKRIVGD